MFISPTKILGVLGGMGPAASAEFLRLLTLKAPARRDQDHPVVYMIADSQIPDRVDAIEGRGENPTARLKNNLETLAGWGAHILATPCNTAHVFIDDFYESLPVPYIHIVKETIRSCQLKSPQGAWLLATIGTCKSGLYEKHAKEMGYTFHSVSSAIQDEVQTCVGLVKSGKLQESGRAMNAIVEKLRHEKDILVTTACTELPLAYDASGLPADKSVSSLVALADACLEELYKGIYTRS